MAKKNADALNLANKKLQQKSRVNQADQAVDIVNRLGLSSAEIVR